MGKYQKSLRTEVIIFSDMIVYWVILQFWTLHVGQINT